MFMMAQTCQKFGLLIWINDDPITGNVLNLINIQSPRKEISEYKEGAKWRQSALDMEFKQE